MLTRKVLRTITITLAAIALAFTLSGGTGMAASLDASPVMANLIANIDADGIDSSHLYEIAGYATLAALAIYHLARALSRAWRATQPTKFPYHQLMHAIAYILIFIGLWIATSNVV